MSATSQSLSNGLDHLFRTLHMCQEAFTRTNKQIISAPSIQKDYEWISEAHLRAYQDKLVESWRPSFSILESYMTEALVGLQADATVRSEQLQDWIEQEAHHMTQRDDLMMARRMEWADKKRRMQFEYEKLKSELALFQTQGSQSKSVPSSASAVNPANIVEGIPETT